MSALLNLSIDVATLPKEKFVTAKNGKVYYKFTVAVNDETKFGNNVSAFDHQTKEEREAKKPKSYLGNGNVFWTDGSVVLAEKEVQVNQEVKIDDLPF
jgi:hypothetical protein